MMKGVKKLLLCLIVIAAVSLAEIMPVFATSPGGSGSEVMAPKKIVSLVFDDSSSMYEDGVDSWAEANYATQVFAALMNPQDEFYITYMSKCDVDGAGNVIGSAGEVDISDPQAAADKIRTTMTDWNLTPIESVMVAEEQLASIDESDPTTQFWLVIMTDGEFQINTDNETYQSIQKACDELKGTPMSNGSPLRIFYYGIGSSSYSVKDDPGNGLEAEKSDDIVGTLNDVANTIAGRLKYDDKDIKFVGEKTIEVSSRIPLYSLSAFTQNSQAEVTSAKTEDTEGNELVLDFNNAKVQSPEPEDVFGPKSERVDGFEDIESPDLHGNVSVISNQDQVIPAGKYTIEFSAPIDKKSLVLMYQPAVTLALTMFIDGNEVKTGAQVTEGSDIELRMTLVDPSTGKEMDKSLLPSGTDYEIVEKWDQGTETASGFTMSVDDIQAGSYSFTGQMTIPGMIPVYSNTISIDVLEYKPDPGIHLKIIQKGSVEDVIVYDNIDGTNLLGSVEADDVITVNAEAIDKNTGEPIDAAKLSATENWNISYQVNGNEEGSKPSNEYRDIKLIAGDNAIVCDYEAGDLAAQEIVEFNVPNPSVYALEAENDPGSFYRKELNKKENVDKAPVIWIVRDEDADRDGIGDGHPQRLSKNETTGTRQLKLDKDNVTVERDDFGLLLNRVGFLNARIELVQNDDGSYSAVPRTGFFRKLLFPYLITTGNYHAIAVLDANSAQQEVVVEVRGKLSDWITLIIELCVIFTICYILYLIFWKPKFKKDRKLHIYAFARGEDDELSPIAAQTRTMFLKPYGEGSPLRFIRPGPSCHRIPYIGIKIYPSTTGQPQFNPDEVGCYWGTARGDDFVEILEKIKEQTERRDNGKGHNHSKPVSLGGVRTYFAKDDNTLYAID